MRIHCLQHVPFETPGTITEWAAVNNCTITYTYFFEENFSLPALPDFDALLILGGYMNVDEEEKFSWLKREKIFIKTTIDASKKILGICLGAQLIAAALGYKVYPGKEKEIGFFPLHFSDAALQHSLFTHFSSTYTLFHWHGDTFDLPDEAIVMASTGVCKHQAFLIGSQILGLQFHLEMNRTTIEQMLLHDGAELEEDGMYIQTVEDVKKGFVFLERNKEDMFLLLDKFFIRGVHPSVTS